MQDQEKKFLGSILYIGMLAVTFVAGVLYEYSYQPLPLPVEVVEVTKIVEVPKVIETVKMVSVPEVIETTRVIEKECTIQPTKDKGWFK